MRKAQVDNIFKRGFNVSGQIEYTPNIMAIIQHFDEVVNECKLPEYREISLDYTLRGRQGKERDEYPYLYIDLSESGKTYGFAIYAEPGDEFFAMETIKALIRIEKFIKNQIDIDELKKYE